MKQTRGAKKQLLDGVIVSWTVEREQLAYVKVMAAKEGHYSQAEAIRNIIDRDAEVQRSTDHD